MLSVRGSLLSLDKIRIHTEQPAAHRLSPPADFDSLTHSSDLDCGVKFESKPKP